MYLEHFGMKEFPFGLTPNSHFYCNLETHQAALNVLLFSLTTGEGFIKIIGEVGSGKTSLCRKLLSLLDANAFVTAYLPNPNLEPHDLCRALAHELQITPIPSDILELRQALSQKIMALRAQNKKVVFILDEAQSLSDESLEMLRLLTNLETESSKLLQIVLLGQPELEERLQRHHLRQLQQRITFSYQLHPLNETQLLEYLGTRLAKAGFTSAFCFEPRACRLLLQASGGLPRLINVLCHKALLAAYGKGDKKVNAQAMWSAIIDSKPLVNKRFWNLRKALFIGIGLGLVLTLGLLIYFGFTHRWLRGF